MKRAAGTWRRASESLVPACRISAKSLGDGEALEKTLEHATCL